MTPRPVRLLFVCVGNTCRSPLAAAVASAVLGSRVQAESAGMAATGRPAAAEAIAVLQERCGIDRSTHRSRPLRAVTLAESSRVIALDPSVYATALSARCHTATTRHAVAARCPSMQTLGAYHQGLTQFKAMIETTS